MQLHLNSHLLAIEEIENVCNKKVIQPQQQTTPQTSGQLKSHYATTTPLLQGNVEELLQQFINKKIAIISFNKKYFGIDEQHQFIFDHKKTF